MRPGIEDEPGGIRSLNFENWAWWRLEASGLGPCDPYSLLPAVSHAPGAIHAGDVDAEGGEELANGGAAMAAYARMQFEKIGHEERRRLGAALLKYCELDTLAMAMIWESWR